MCGVVGRMTVGDRVRGRRGEGSTRGSDGREGERESDGEKEGYG